MSLLVQVLGIIPRWSSVAYCIFGFVAPIILLLWAAPQKRQRYANAPMAGIRANESLQKARERYRTDAKSMLQEGYAKYKGQPFYVPTLEGDKLMVPKEFVDEMKNFGDDQADAAEPVFQAFESKYTLLASRELLHRRCIRNHLPQNIDQQKDILVDEVQNAISDTIGQCNTWDDILIADCIVRTVARVTSRSFGGLDLSRNKDWIEAVIGSTEDAVLGAQKIKVWPWFLKPIAAYFIPEITRCQQHYNTARKIIVPLLEQRERLPPSERPNDFLQWMMNDAQGAEKRKIFLADMQLNISFTALFTTTAAILQVLYDLCAMPEYLAPLRDEIDEVLNQFGTLDRISLGQLHKLDSFMKESQRFNPLVLVTFTRWIWDDLNIGGFVIPAHTNIGYPAQAALMDAELYPDPFRFDGFRFAKLRGRPDQDCAPLQWASASLNNLPFGYGRVSCPGRQFASVEIKMILVEILTRYELGSLERRRPESLHHDATVLPDPTVRIPMKKREVV